MGLIGGIIFLAAISHLGIESQPNLVSVGALGRLLGKEFDKTFPEIGRVEFFYD